jgi:hypothetical protein
MAMTQARPRRAAMLSGALAVLVAPGASAGRPGFTGYGTRAFLSPYDPVFHGRAGSVRPKCERHRTVQVQRFSNRHVIGTTTTNKFGRWKLKRPGVHGRFFARVRYKRLIRPGLICFPSGRSHVIRFG